MGKYGALAEKLGNGLQNRVDGSVTRRCLHIDARMVDYVTCVDTIVSLHKSCADGGIGRHERLKISWLHGRAGSSPALRTKQVQH